MKLSMEGCMKKQKSEAMGKYYKIAYNLGLYSLTSIITCFFFSSPFWFPSITNHFFPSLPRVVSFCFNAKCFFVVGNLIVLILVGETKLKQPSSSDDIYDQYVARSRSNHHVQYHVEEKKTKNSSIEPENKGHIMRRSSSEVWGEGGMLKTKKISKGKKEEKMGMRSSKSAVWGEGGMLKAEKISKGTKKEEKMGMRSSKSAVWGEGGIMEKITEGKKEIKKGLIMKSSKSAVWSNEGEKEEQPRLNDEVKKMGMKSSKSAVWSESERGKGKMEEQIFNKINVDEEEEKKMGMRSCKSEIWSESEIVRLGKNLGKLEEDVQINMLNKRVEDFIARVNKQRLLEDG